MLWTTKSAIWNPVQSALGVKSLMKRAVLFTRKACSWYHIHPLNEQSCEVFLSRFFTKTVEKLFCLTLYPHESLGYRKSSFGFSTPSYGNSWMDFMANLIFLLTADLHWPLSPSFILFTFPNSVFLLIYSFIVSKDCCIVIVYIFDGYLKPFLVNVGYELLRK